MLNILQKNRLCNVLIVVTRYFGGILLGTGGLVRCYSGSTIGAIENSNKIEIEPGIEYNISIDYQDFQSVQYYCKKNNIDCYAKRIDVQKYANNNKVGTEEAGRILRYEFFDEILEHTNSQKIAIAHNKNDKAETIIMNLLRGAGLTGLKGIEPIRNNKYIRPILEMERNEIEEYCEYNSLNPRIDKSNHERIYSRNRVRLDILPYMKEHFNDDIVETLNRMVLLLQKDNEFIEEYSKRCYNKYCKTKINELIIKKELFKDEMDSIISRVIIMAFKNISNSHENFEMKHINQITSLSKNSTGKKINLTNNIVCENLYGDIIFKSNQSQNKNNNNKVLIKKEEFSNNIYFEDYEIKFQVIDNNYKGKFPKNDLIKLFDYDKIKRDILIRHRKDGDKIVPLGMNGSKKIKDIFMDLKIPRDDRDEIPIVCFDDEISWVVGCKTSQKFKITKDTKKILKIAFSRKG